jgi:hypothetical protein
VSGACFAADRNTFEQIGGFDERFFLYFEDTELSMRARLAGYECLAVPGAVVLHDHRAGFSPQKLRYVERNRLWGMSKLLEWRTLLLILPALAFGDVLAWGFAIRLGPRHIVAKARAWIEFLSWLPSLPSARRRMRRLRAISDADLLRPHRTRLPFSQVAQGDAADLGEQLVYRCFQLARWIFYRLNRR